MPAGCCRKVYLESADNTYSKQDIFTNNYIPFQNQYWNTTIKSCQQFFDLINARQIEWNKKVIIPLLKGRQTISLCPFIDWRASRGIFQRTFQDNWRRTIASTDD